jgi:hypothetical protein
VCGASAMPNEGARFEIRAMFELALICVTMGAHFSACASSTGTSSCLVVSWGACSSLSPLLGSFQSYCARLLGSSCAKRLVSMM